MRPTSKQEKWLDRYVHRRPHKGAEYFKPDTHYQYTMLRSAGLILRKGLIQVTPNGKVIRVDLINNTICVIKPLTLYTCYSYACTRLRKSAFLKRLNNFHVTNYKPTTVNL